MHYKLSNAPPSVNIYTAEFLNLEFPSEGILTKFNPWEAKIRGLEERLERLCDRIRPKILVKFICEDGGRVER